MRLLFCAIFTLSLGLAASVANAQETSGRHPLLENDFMFSAGAFLNNKTIRLSVDGEVPSEEIEFSEKWGLGEDKTSAAMVFSWKFGEKWSVAGQYFSTDDSATATLDEDVEWEDWVFGEGSAVSAGIDLQVARIFFGRTFHEGPNHDFVAGAGLHWIEIGAFVEGNAIINGESVGSRRSSVSAAAPLPNIGAAYRYAFSPKWLLDTRLDWFHANIDEYSGSLWNGSVGVEYQAFKNVGFALAYQAFKLDVDVKKGNWRGSADLTYKGPFLSVTATW